MAVLQTAVVGPLARFVGPARQAALGFVFMAAGIGALMVVRSFPAVLTGIGVLVLGTALVVPSLSSLVATTSGRRFGAALGLKSSAISLDQFLGPLVGGSMLAWRQASQRTGRTHAVRARHAHGPRWPDVRFRRAAGSRRPRRSGRVGDPFLPTPAP
jgi:MFS family permease